MDSATLAAEKAALRSKLRALLAQATEQELVASNVALQAAFLASEELKNAQNVLLFHSIGREIDTQTLFAALRAEGKQILLPRCLPERQMEARLLLSERALAAGAFGILEPTQACPLVQKTDIDLILVPNLCCDEACYRLGQGGGYYDRYLADYQGKTISLCRELLLQQRLPRGAYDQPVFRVLTEKRSLSLS